MCQEVFDMVCRMDSSALELQFALQCAPVITGVKVSNLFTLERDKESEFRKMLRKSQLQYVYMTQKNGKATYLVYRYHDLQKHIKKDEVLEYLNSLGYHSASLGTIIRTIQKKYHSYLSEESQCFPHEIGVLLGYPMDDVKGFIEHEGREYLYSGYWKVYSDVVKKKKIFQSYENAKEDLIFLIAADFNMQQIMDIYYMPQNKFVS